MYERHDTPNCVSNNGIELLFVSHYSSSRRWTGTRHAHDFWELFLCLSNTCDFFIRDESLAVHPGDFVVVNPGVEHSETSPGHKWIVFGLKGIQNLFEESASGYIKGNFGQNTQILTDLAVSLFNEAKQKPSDYQRACLCIVELILLHIRRITGACIPTDAVAGGLNRQSAKRHNIIWIRQYIDANFNQALNLEILSGKIGLNKYSLIREFKHAYGVSPMEYYFSRRFREAEYLLSTTDHSINHIGLAVGFSSGNYFSQSFLKRYGISPTAYRRLHKRGRGAVSK